MRNEKEINEEATKAAYDLGISIFNSFCILKKLSELDMELVRTKQESEVTKNETHTNKND